jgi:decaprenylphospho-beta-D-ribofuranose 2-oxidase
VHRVQDANEAAALVRRVSATSDLAYAWLDCARPKAASFGRGLVFDTRLASGGTADTDLPPARLTPEHGRRIPFCLMNGWSMSAINLAHAYRSRRAARLQDGGLPKVLFPIHGNELYFRLFGRNGFLEYQAVVPHGRVEEYVRRVRELGARFGICFTLAIARVFRGQNDLLRFDGEGIGFAFELPRQGRALDFMAAVDDFVTEIGARPNIYKDSRLPRAVVEASYPDCDKFRAIRRAWDPRRRFRSELSERLGI